MQKQRKEIDNEMIKATTSLKVLFVCTANIQRSLTAEHLCAQQYLNIEFKSAGVSRKECSRNNSTLCTEELLEWADIVFTFEAMHIDRIIEHTRNRHSQKLINLDIEDKYEYGDAVLESLISAKVKQYLEF